jgi:hypothetical protein
MLLTILRGAEGEEKSERQSGANHGKRFPENHPLNVLRCAPSAIRIPISRVRRATE